MVSDTSTSDTAVSNPTSSDSTDSDSTDSDSTGSDSTDSTSTSDGAVSNVLLVTIDSLRADAIGPYDNDRYSPVLSDLAADGTVFDRSFATGNWTPFSFPSILASEPVFARNGDIGVTGARTLASVLSEAGIATGGFNAANGFLTSHWGYPEGFDEFEPFVTSVGSSRYSRYLAAHPTVEAWIQLATSPFRRLGSKLRGESDDRPFLDASRMFDVEDSATEFVDDTDEPFFLWVHYMDTHTPYVPAPRYIREVSDGLIGTHRMLHAHTRTSLGWEVGERTLGDLRTLYQATVRQVDASVGRLLDTLEAAGIADETAIVVAGDHGEEFQEHGHLAHYPKLYDELIHVPLIVNVPGEDGGRRVSEHVGLDAIPPTVADLLDVESPPEWRGESLEPAVSGGESPDQEPVVSVTVRGEEVTEQPIPRSLSDGDLLVSVRDAEWTYIENADTAETELYHRPSDPTQQEDLSADPSDEALAVVERFAPIVADHVAELRDRQTDAEAADDGEDEEVDEHLEARLEALGYR
ncbi:sulfatase [Halorubrum lacusprofundi]|jgi:arylsulfatase A-like enzyme|uniref:Sulfatase n=1 Tax=Halorubrum lacusprofundi (strain ATCC 49239 / DSM 5036 / JCM 8891 / ACAM 34) TaxID=416348 RepID=B9LP95_HALLT|nr:sulfatase [Halorubrum lacusprofundi]ACM57183.1 sulfatase [Halorubrum lacusprofundi ATCC 49239]MCG1007292.1 sulfatase [Halorubrum lacusprofundi]